MAQKEDVSSSPAKAPKSQLAVEPPLTGGRWNPSEKKKKTPHIQRQEKLQQDGWGWGVQS